MRNSISVLGLCSAMLFGQIASAVAQDLPRNTAPENAKTYIVSPKDGDVVEKEFTVVFGLEGMGVAPAGTDVAGTGHHHLLVNQEALPDMNMPMGNPPIHFGKGQTQTTLTLEPGTHTLQLILGDMLHIPHLNPVVSEKITITVKE